MALENNHKNINDDEKMVLRTTMTSPYGRKVRIAAIALGIEKCINIQLADTRDPKDTLRQQNPLGKMPCLILKDGQAIYDSGVIIEYFGQLASNNQLMPWTGIDRIHAQTKLALCNGITDASLLMVYEHRFRGEKQVSQIWLDHCAGKVLRGLTEIQSNLPNPEITDAISISLACALGYLDWRTPVDWRPAYPILGEWLKAFSNNQPAFAQTKI